MEDYDFFQRHNSIKGVTVKGTDRLFLLDFVDKNYFETFEKEFGNFEIAGLYLLINSKNDEIYVGESGNLKERNKGEIKKGYPNEMEDFEFDKIILIWDGRPTKTSLFGDTGFRKSLEKYCIKQFKEYRNGKCRNSVGEATPTNFQTETNFEKFKEHILLLFEKHGLDVKK